MTKSHVVASLKSKADLSPVMTPNNDIMMHVGDIMSTSGFSI